MAKPKLTPWERAWSAHCSASVKITLLVIADHADEDGNNSVLFRSELAELTGKTTRQISRDVQTLITGGYIKLGDQSRAEHLRKRIPTGDGRGGLTYAPTVYDLT